MPTLPKISKLFFEWYCNPELEEQILGDLQEQFEEDVALFGLAKARRRFTWNVIRFCRPGIIKKYKGIQKLNNTGMFKHNVKIAFRNLKRQRSTAFINISGLVLGLSVTLMIALWVKNELSWDKNNENYDRVVRVMQNRVFDEQPMAIKALPVSLASELKENYHDVFDHVVLSSFYWDALISKGDDGVNVKGVRTQPGAPHIMSLEMINGTRESLKQEETILLSASTAYALFGEDSPIGNTVVLNEETMIVRGVYKDLPNTSSFKSVGFLAKIGDSRDVNWESNNYQIFAAISSNVTIEEVNNKIQTIINEHLPTDKQNEKNAVFLHPMKDWHLRSSWKNGVQSGGGIVYVHWFILIGLLVLFLACINFMNLSTAQSIRRAKEVGIRKAIGSVRNQLIIQFMTESIVLVFLSFLIVTGLSYLITPYFNLLTDKQISVPLDTWQYWIYGIMCVISIGILAGSYPAFYLSSFKPLLVLKGTYQTNLSAAIFRKAMVVFQFAISIALIIGTIVISQQIDHTLNRPLGYDGESVISIPMSSSDHYSKANIIENELINSGAITQYAETFNPLTEVWMMNNDFSWVGKDPSFTPMINTLYVSSGFGETVKWKVVEGRDFDPTFATDSSAIILNEKAANILGFDSSVGISIDWQGGTYKVIGVVEDLQNDSPFKEVGPTFYLFGSRARSNYSLLRLNSNLSQIDAINQVAEIYEKLIPNSPFEFEFVNDAHERKFRSINRIGSLSSIFSSFAITISCLGLFGLASFMVEQRTKEIGIRKVLGASAIQLWRLISQEFILLMIISSAIAIPISIWVLKGWLEDYEYRISLQWWVFLIGCLGALVLTILTTSFKSLTAINLNPAETLKDE